MVETIEKKLSGSFNAMPGLVNLPNKGEIATLTSAMKKLNTNIELLKKQKAL